MRLILLGPPGCGKGTQAKTLCRDARAEHVGTGDLLRDAIRRETPAGIEARREVDAGHLVPDEVVNLLIGERFGRGDRPSRFVMDGYPRTLPQAHAFDSILSGVGMALDGVVMMQVRDELIVNRVSGRWSCPKLGCKATYHIDSNPPARPGFCTDCGTGLVQRADDAPATVRERLVIYHRDTEPLVPHYEKAGILIRVDGEGDIGVVGLAIRQALATRGLL
ncbi:MAG: adenylate kinase [Planctomycetota bacterium]